MPQLRAPRPYSFTDRPESKRQGEIAELVFLYRATVLGLKVSKPYGESERYDFIVDTGRRLLRVQIKSTRGLISKGAYRISGGRNILGGTVPYLPSQVDFIAAYIFPEDTWYILPLSALSGRIRIRLHSLDNPKPNQLTQYREAWPLLLAEPTHV